MGRDKAEIIYGSLPQWQAVAGLLKLVCAQVRWSCTRSQRETWGLGANGIEDQEPGLGPGGGLHAAFTRNEGVAWLVVGCDYPNLTAGDCQRLAGSRTAEVQAIALGDPVLGTIEPTLSIWEPPAQRRFLQAFAEGERSPRRVLHALRLRIVAPADPRTLEDRNTPEGH